MRYFRVVCIFLTRESIRDSAAFTFFEEPSAALEEKELIRSAGSERQEMLDFITKLFETELQASHAK